MTVKLLEDQRDAHFPLPAATGGLSLPELQGFLHHQLIYIYIPFHTLLLGEMKGKCCKLSPFNYFCYYGYTRKLKTIYCPFGEVSISTTLLVGRQKHGKQSLAIVIKKLRRKRRQFIVSPYIYFLLPSFIHRVIYLIFVLAFRPFF